MASQRTKDVKKRKIVFFIIDSILWIGTALFSVITVLVKFGKSESSDILSFLSENAKGTVISISVTAIIGLILTIFLKEKMRNTLWIASMLICSILFKTTGMYVVAALWLIEDWVFHNLYEHYKAKVSINKEIDLRS